MVLRKEYKGTRRWWCWVAVKRRRVSCSHLSPHCKFNHSITNSDGFRAIPVYSWLPGHCIVLSFIARLTFLPPLLLSSHLHLRYQRIFLPNVFAPAAGWRLVLPTFYLLCPCSGLSVLRPLNLDPCCLNISFSTWFIISVGDLPLLFHLFQDKCAEDW